MADDLKSLELLFQRPLEPIFTPRDNGKVAFELPDSYYTSDFSTRRMDVQSRFADNVEQKVPLGNLENPPDLSFASELDKKQQFSLFIDEHKKIAGQLIKIYMDAPDWRTFRDLCAYTKDRLNPLLFQYCFAVAVHHRPDTVGVAIPPIVETFPMNFVEPSAFNDARVEASLVADPKKRKVIKIDRNYTASDREEEQRLAYFREDIGANLHHWHWHLVYPAEGPQSIVAKDRRGELFYYMHHQMIARYNVERYCNNLATVKSLNSLREPIPEGYFPKMLNSANNRTYPSRASHQKLSDLNRSEIDIEIAKMERWTDRIYAAIDQGYVENTEGIRFRLDEIQGIDILGNLLEASSLSINPQFYGNLHNMGHNLIACAHDPEDRFLEPFGVMVDNMTAMRDPIFYRWHAFLDDIFNHHKALLPPYGESHLGFDGIRVDYVEIKLCAQPAIANTLKTYWAESCVNLANGLPFGFVGKIYAQFTHLQHAPFTYTINVTNSCGIPKLGTCRIFLCPKADERGTPLKLEEQRLMVVEMDKFTWEFQPGRNTILRRSDESSLTIAHESTFPPFGGDLPPPTDKESFCGCGWPQHLLVPKGRPEGMMFDLFVMISDFDGDAVDQSSGKPGVCRTAHPFCGLRDKLYPDKRTMGYPFDRRLPGNTLQELTKTYGNMMTTNIVVKFDHNYDNRI